jgi:hypothetical protein
MFTMLAHTTRLPSSALAALFNTGFAPAPTRQRLSLGAAGQALLAWPFDALRLQHASAVRSGLLQRSILASGKLERALETLEKLLLGPFARQR